MTRKSAKPPKPTAAELDLLRLVWRLGPSTVKDVHQARVASRRLREALPVLGAIADDAAIDRARSRVRRITRALGPVRELDVTLLLLAELEAKGAAPKRAIARVRQAVVEERDKRRRTMLQEIKPSRLEKLRKRLVKVAAPETRREPTRTPSRSGCSTSRPTPT